MKKDENNIDSDQEEDESEDDKNTDIDEISFNLNQTKLSSIINPISDEKFSDVNLKELNEKKLYDNYFIGSKFYYLKFYYSFLNDKNYEKIYKIFLKNYQSNTKNLFSSKEKLKNNKKSLKNNFLKQNLSFLISKKILKLNNNYFNLLLNMNILNFHENFEIFLLNYYNNFSLHLWYILRENFQFFNFIILLKNFFLLYHGEFFNQFYLLIFQYLYTKNKNNEKFFINFHNDNEKNYDNDDDLNERNYQEYDEYNQYTDEFDHIDANNGLNFDNKFISTFHFKKYQSKLYYKNKKNNFFNEFNEKIEFFQLNSNKIYNNLLNFFILPSIITSNNSIFSSSSNSSALPSLIHFYFENNFFYNENFKNFNFLSLKMNGYYDYSFNLDSNKSSDDNNDNNFNGNQDINNNEDNNDVHEEDEDELLKKFNQINDEVFLLNKFNSNLYPNGIILNNFNNKNIKKYFQILNYYLRYHFTSINKQNSSNLLNKNKKNFSYNFWNSFQASDLSSKPSSIYTNNFYLNSSLWWKNDINYLYGFKKKFNFNFLWMNNINNIINCLHYFFYKKNDYKDKFFLNIPLYKRKTFINELKSSNISNLSLPQISSVLSSVFCCLQNDKKGTNSNGSGDLSRGINNSLMFGVSFHSGFLEDPNTSTINPVFYARLLVARGSTEGMRSFPHEQPIKFMNNFTSGSTSPAGSTPIRNDYENYLTEEKAFDFILSEKFVDLNIKPGKSLGKYNLVVDYNKTIHYSSTSPSNFTSSSSTTKGEIQYIIKVKLEELDESNETSPVLQTWTLDYFLDLSTFLQDTAFIGVTSSSLILPNIEEKVIDKNNHSENLLSSNNKEVENKIKVLTKLPYVLNFQLSNINLVLKNNTENLVLISSPYLINNYNKLYKILYYENKKLENFLTLKLNITNYSLIFSILFDHNSIKIYQKLFSFLYRINIIKYLFNQLWYNNNKFLLKKFYNTSSSSNYTYSTYSTVISSSSFIQNDDEHYMPNKISFQYYYKKLYKIFFLMNYFLNNFLTYLQIDVIDSNFNEFFQNILSFSGPSHKEVLKHFEYFFVNNLAQETKEKNEKNKSFVPKTSPKQPNFTDIEEEDYVKNAIEEIFNIINTTFKLNESKIESDSKFHVFNDFSSSFFSPSSEGIQGVRRSHIKFQTSLLRLCHLDQNNTLKSVEKLLLLIARFITLFKLFVELEYDKEDKKLYYQNLLNDLYKNSAHLSEDEYHDTESKILDEMNNDEEDEISVPIEEFEWIKKEFLLNLNFLRNYLLTNIDYTSSFLLRLDFNNFFSNNENNL